VCFGIAVARAGLFPRWTGYALAVGVILVAATNSLPDPARTVAAAMRAAAFIGMGAAVLRMDGRAGRG
jgi:Ca2+/Na+ antiporter